MRKRTVSHPLGEEAGLCAEAPSPLRELGSMRRGLFLPKESWALCAEASSPPKEGWALCAEASSSLRKAGLYAQRPPFLLRESGLYAQRPPSLLRLTLR